MNFLFLRGLARHHGHWYGFENNFKSNNQVLCIDIPGNGDFTSLKSLCTIEENVEFVRAEWNKKKIENGKPWCVIAISMGGMIALYWEHLFPNDFDQAFIINSSAKNITLPWNRFSLNTFFKLPKLLFSTDAEKEKVILDLTLNLRKVDIVLFNQMKTSHINFFIQLQAAARFSLPSFNLDQSHKINIIASKKDRLVDYHSSVKMSELLKCKIFIHPEAGHDLPLDDSEWLKKTIFNNIN